MIAKSKVAAALERSSLMMKPEEASMIDYEALLSKSLLRIDEAAILLDITPRTVQRYLDSGKRTPVVMPGGRRRVRTDEIKRYL